MTLEYRTIIEANRNRFKEGARVLEDIARFIFNDMDLFIKIKNLKHQIVIRSFNHLNKNDLGGLTFCENNNRENLINIIHANATRMQEALRVLEELDDNQKYKKLRFITYEIHQEIIHKHEVFSQKNKLIGIYPICDPTLMSLEDMANYLNNNNISICQLRMKNKPPAEVYSTAKIFKDLLKDDILFIINDYVDVALMLADGVHVGQQDMPVESIRKISPQSFVIGTTCHNLQEAQNARSYGASYISLGCIYQTTTKKDTIPISLSTIHTIKQSIDMPICAIGGINPTNLDSLKDIGINFFGMCEGFWQPSY